MKSVMFVTQPQSSFVGPVAWVRCVQEHDRLRGLGVDWKGCRRLAGGCVEFQEQVSGVEV